MGNSFVKESENYSDNEIISRFKSNDFDCIQLLIDKYMPLVINYARSFDVSPIETEELIAEGVVSIFSAVKSYDPEKSKFSTFVSVCIKRAMLDWIKTSNRAKRIPSEMITDIDDVEIKGFDSPEEILIDKESLEEFKSNIFSFLSETELSVLKLYLEGNTYSDISDKLGISLKSVDNALTRVRNKLKDK